MLSQKQIQQVINTIIEKYQPEKIFLFGSYAYGTPDKNSDLDLLIIKNTHLSFYQRLREVQDHLDDYRFDMDILVYTPAEFENSANTFCTIAYTVNKKGKVVYGN